MKDHKALNDWPCGEQQVSPRPSGSGNIEVEEKRNSLFPAGLVIKCFAIPPNSIVEKNVKK